MKRFTLFPMATVRAADRSWFLSLFGLTILILWVPGLSAQEKPEKSEDSGISLLKEGHRPLVTVTFSGADRFVEEAEYLFDAAGQPKAFGVAKGWLESTLNNLNGFDRNKPFGLMFFLPAIFPPIPEVVAFVPVESIDEATKLVEKAPVVIKKSSADENRYEIIGPNQTVPMLLKHGYAFIPFDGNSDTKVLDRDFPDPATLVAGQAQQFDVSVTLDLASIPVGTRTLLTNVLTSGVSTQLQQRDGEPDGAYRIRRIEGERVLAFLRQLLEECQRIILGVDVIRSEHAVNLDVVIEAAPGSQILQDILQSAQLPSTFAPLLNESAAVSLCSSSRLNERDRKAFTEMLEAFRSELFRRIEAEKLGDLPDENGAIGLGISAAQKTLEKGDLDLFAQFYQDSSEKLVIVGGMRLEDGAAFAAGLQDVLVRFAPSESLKQFGTVSIASGQHLGITFHRLDFAEQSDDAVAVFGKEIGLTVGCGDQTLWVCLGGADSFSVLSQVLDEFDTARRQPVETAGRSSSRIIVNVSQLVAMQQKVMGVRTQRSEDQADAGQEATASKDTAAGGGSPSNEGSTLEDDDPESRRRRQRNRFEERRARAGKVFRETMTEGDDRIEVTFQPTDTGGRIRMRLEEGFVKVLGRLIAARLLPAE
jgi:hypothetical protein